DSPVVRVVSALVLAVLVLAPASVAGTPQSGVAGRLAQPSSNVSEFWDSIAARPLSPSWAVPSAAGSAVQQQQALENALVRDINAVRRGHGLKPFIISARLSAAAEQHTREMGADGYFEHDSFDSTPFWKRI